MSTRHEVTAILDEWNQGPAQAAGKLFPLVYAELKKIAALHFASERSGHTLQPTALVHEAFLKLVDQNRVQWQGRSHFMAVAATIMRRVLVDYARAHHAARRGGDAKRMLLAEDILATTVPPTTCLELNEALEALEKLDARQARVVEMRFFGGMTVEEIAAVESLSVATVKRYWRSARAFLHRELAEGTQPDTGTLEPGP